MSHIPDPQWNPYDPQPPRRGNGPLLIVLLVMGAIGSVFLIGFVGIVIYIASMEGQWDETTWAGDLDSSEPPHPQDWAAVRAAYDLNRPPVDAETVARLQPLLDEFVRCSNEGDQNGLRRIVDFSRLFRQMKASRFAADIALFDQPMLQRHLAENVSGLSGWDRIVIVAVTDSDKRGEKIVYGHGFHDDHYSNPVRFWVADNRRPKLFDWELLEYGIRESGDWAISCAYDGQWQREEHIAAAAEIEQAETLWDEGEEAKAKAMLRAATLKKTPPPVHDEFLLGAAYTWLQWRETDEVHAACERMKNIESAPGAIYVQAQAYFHDGQHEECLQAIEKFEAVVGTTPETLARKAQACDELQRWDEAKQHYGEVVKILRDDPVALDDWVSVLESDDKELLKAHLSTLDNGVEVATAISGRMSYDDDAVALLSEVIADLAPDSPAASFLKAIALQQDGEFAPAAKLYRECLDSSEDETQIASAQWRYMSCVIELGQSVEAYQQAEDPQFIYNYLVEDYEYDGSLIPHDQLTTIVDEQLQRFPDDPWNYYYASIIKDEGEATLPTMQKLIRDGLRRAREANDEDAETTLNVRLVELMFRDGKAMAAYRTVKPAKQTFRELADWYRFGDRPLGELQTLIEAHAAEHPDDPWLPYYRAVVRQDADDLSGAATILWQAYNRDDVQDDEQIATAYRYLRLGIFVAQEKYLDAYRQVFPAEETFDYLASHLHGAKLWEPLEKLFALHEKNHGDDPQLLQWRVQMDWTRERYDNVAALLRDADDRVDELAYYEQANLRLWHMRALLRTGQLDEAREVARQQRDDRDDLYPLILVHVSAGETDSAARLIEEYAKTAYSLSRLYEDEDVGELLRGPDYDELRRAVPSDLPYSYAQASCVLLLDQPASLTSERAQQVATKLFGAKSTVQAIPGDQLNQAGAYLLTHESQRAVIVYGNDRYQSHVDLRNEGVTDKALRNLYERHQGWIAVEFLMVEDAAQATPALLQATALLMDEQTLLVNTPAGWLLPGGEATARRLATGNEKALPGDTEVWLYREAKTSDAEKTWNRQREKQLQRLDELFTDRANEQTFHLLVTLSVGDAVEVLWLRLERIDRRGRDERTFVAEFEQSPLLFSEIKLGDFAAVDGYRIRNWKMTDGDKVTLARP